MALSIGVKRGSKIRIGQETLEVMDIVPPHLVSVKVMGKIHDVTDKQRTEILPEVFVSYGRPQRNDRTHLAPSARLAFEAPVSIKITRP